LNNSFLIVKQFLLLGILLLVFLLFFNFHLYEYCTFNHFKESHHLLQQWMRSNYLIIVIAYIIIFSILIACAIPCATLLTLFGGFLFGKIAVLYSVLGITIGGTILFLAVRISIGKHVIIKSDGLLKKIEHGFQQNAFHYLLMMRLIPIFPCWLSNISAGMLNVPFKTFLSATMLGVVPATFIYVLAGKGLKKIIEWQETDILNLVFTPTIFFPLFGLAMLSLFPLLYKKFNSKRSSVL
jgi:uncharacterized membrane protein YdjX (TVP38/TMEM64 family)